MRTAYRPLKFEKSPVKFCLQALEGLDSTKSSSLSRRYVLIPATKRMRRAWKLFGSIIPYLINASCCLEKIWQTVLECGSASGLRARKLPSTYPLQRPSTGTASLGVQGQAGTNAGHNLSLRNIAPSTSQPIAMEEQHLSHDQVRIPPSYTYHVS